MAAVRGSSPAPGGRRPARGVIVPEGAGMGVAAAGSPLTTGELHPGTPCWTGRLPRGLPGGEPAPALGRGIGLAAVPRHRGRRGNVGARSTSAPGSASRAATCPISVPKSCAAAPPTTGTWVPIRRSALTTSCTRPSRPGPDPGRPVRHETGAGVRPARPHGCAVRPDRLVPGRERRLQRCQLRPLRRLSPGRPVEDSSRYESG